MSEKDRERKHRSGGSSAPGAHSSSIVSADERRRRSEDRKSKGRASGGEHTASVGAQSASSASDRARRKEARHGSHTSSSTGGTPVLRGKEGARPPDQPTSKLQTAPLDNGYQVEATAVNDSEADERVRKLEAQMAAMMQGGGAAPVVAATVTPANPDGNDSDDASEEGEERSCFQKYKFLILLAFVVVVAGAVLGYVFGTKSSNEEPSSVTSSAYKYPPPDEVACSRLQTASWLNTGVVVFVDVTVEVTLVNPKTDDEIDRALQFCDEAVVDRLIPYFIGCPVSSRRRLLSDTLTPLRYMIGDALRQPAFTFDDEIDAQCDDDKPESCFRALYEFDFYLKGDESQFVLMQLVTELFAERGEEVLALPPDVISSIRIADTKVINESTEAPVPPTIVDPVAPTQAPASGPTPTPVSGPTPSPPTPAPISEPTQPPVAEPTQPPLDATERRDTLLELLNPLVSNFDAAALNWLGDVDTWQPASGSSTESQQWIERYVMVVLYYATNGDNWGTGWLDTTKSVCDGWRGIDICANGLIVDVNLQNFGLTGTLPSEISLLAELTSLQAGQNGGVGGPIPTEFGNLSKLQDLVLQQNALTGTIPTEIARLASLTLLSLWDSNLSGTIPALPSSIVYFYVSGGDLVGPLPSIGLLTNLLEFEVHENFLTGQFPEDLELLTRMESFRSFNNSIAGTIPTTIGKMTGLRNLEIDKMELDGTIPTEIGLLKRVTKFDAYLNNLVGAIPTEIGQMIALEELIIHQNNLRSSIPSEIGRLTDLWELKLYTNDLSGTIPTEIFRNLLNLEVLQLEENNRLSGTIPTEVGFLTKLWKLEMYETNVDGTIPTEIGRAIALEVLFLHKTELSGSIPSEISNLASLEELLVHENNLTGVVPPLPSSLENCEMDWNCFSNLDNAVARGCNVDSNCA